MAGKTSGIRLVDGLDGSELAKSRLKAVLLTLTGEQTVIEAARSLGWKEAYFYRVRDGALQAALSALEPKKRGRKPRAPDPQAERIRELEEELRRVGASFEVAQAQIALALGRPRSATRPKGRRRARPR